MSGQYDYEQADKAIGSLIAEGKCLFCQGRGIIWDWKLKEHVECEECKGTGKHDYGDW